MALTVLGGLFACLTVKANLLTVPNAQHNTQSKYVKNYAFSFNFGPPYGDCEVTMTCVSGHMTKLEFGPEVKDWKYPPPEHLFTAPVHTVIPDDKKGLAENIERQARYCRALIIWTDCDLEGEHIGSEIRDAARKGKPSIEIRRAHFSNIERAYVSFPQRESLASYSALI